MLAWKHQSQINRRIIFFDMMICVVKDADRQIDDIFAALQSASSGLVQPTELSSCQN
jgi:hypothetical protein